MRNFWILFKVNLLNSLRLNKLRKKFVKDRFTQIFFPVLIFILGLLVIGLFSLYLYTFFGMFHLVGEYQGMLITGISISMILVFMTTISTANSYLFVSKDYDLLMALPIKPQTIIASKFSNLLFINYIFFGLIYIPTIILYSYYVHPNFIFYILSILLLFVGPLLIITIASAIAYFIELLLSRVKYRNWIAIISMMTIFFLFMFLYFKFTFGLIADENSTDLKPIVDRIVLVFQRIYYPSKWAAASLTGDFLSLCLYIAISVVPFILFIYIVGHNFTKTVARAKITYQNKNYKLGEQKASGQTKALLKREFKMFFSNASVVINIMAGSIMGTIFLVMFVANKGFLNIEELMTLLDIKQFLPLIALAITLMMNGIMATTGSSISLEGKTLWIVKSAPIKTETILKSKTLFNLVLALPFLIINTIIVTIFISPTILDILMFLIISILVNLIDGAYGLFINLCFPKLDWENPLRVVKQSLSTIIIMFSSMIFIGGLIAFTWFIIDILEFGLILVYLLDTLLLVGLLVILVIILKTIGVKKFYLLKA